MLTVRDMLGNEYQVSGFYVNSSNKMFKIANLEHDQIIKLLLDLNKNSQNYVFVTSEMHFVAGNALCCFGFE